MDTRNTNQNMASVCVVGLGFVGLPLAIEFWRRGYHVTGIDVDQEKISSLLHHRSYLSDVTDAEIQDLVVSGGFTCTTNFELVSRGDAVIVCVPTPVNEQGLPDIGYILDASRSVARHLREGQIFILESSTFPGTSEQYVVPVLETYAHGLRAGVDFHVAYSPERINPGERFDIRQIPKIVGGINETSLKKAIEVYSGVFETVVPVSGIRVAELTKLLENTQRFINISVMNELVMLCNKWGISLWEAIEAAATKPYGFTPYYPGPGIGGHCIPVDPLYLDWFAKGYGGSVEFIKLAHRINEEMPDYIVTRILELAKQEKPRILLVGITYKRDVNDVRESASLKVLKNLLNRQIDTAYFDPHVPEIALDEQSLQSISLVPDVIKTFDAVTILTDHTNLDYDLILQNARVIFDTRNVFSKTQSANVVLL